MLNFAHFNQKNTHINTYKNVQKYKTVLQMNNNRAYMHDYCSCANNFLFFFSLSSLGYSLICLLLTTKKEKCGWGHVDSGLFDIIKKLKKYYYLNKIDDRIDKLM